MKKITAILILLSTSCLSAITSTMSHRVVSTEPLLYSMIDYSKKQLSIEAAPFFLSMYDADHVNQNIMLDGASVLTLDQQGGGDINPTWLNLISNNRFADYQSAIILKPQLSQAGMLLHLYKEYKKYYFDIRTAILECSTQINMEEIGTKNGAILGISNALQAFTQPDWKYGKIGDLNQVAGLDDIQVKIGGKFQTTANESDIFITGFALVQAPTGSGTKAEWLFEPQIGTNHWGLGAGFETMMHSNDLTFLLGGDYRYFMPAWETRSFDLINNGQWSRYLGIQELYGLPIAPSRSPLPGINYLTQLAEIQGRNQVNMYVRLEKKLRHCAFEISYNFFYNQEETIGDISRIDGGYGIYTLTGSAGGGGAVVTSSNATIDQAVTIQDPLLRPVIITTEMFDKTSAQAQSFTSNSLAARIQRFEDTYNYGIGFNVEIAQSAGAMSSWAIWAKFEYLFASKSEKNTISDAQKTFTTSELFQDIKNNTDDFYNATVSDNAVVENGIEKINVIDNQAPEFLQEYITEIESYELNQFPKELIEFYEPVTASDTKALPVTSTITTQVTPAIIPPVATPVTRPIIASATTPVITPVATTEKPSAQSNQNVPFVEKKSNDNNISEGTAKDIKKDNKDIKVENSSAINDDHAIIDNKNVEETLSMLLDPALDMIFLEETPNNNEQVDINNNQMKKSGQVISIMLDEEKKFIEEENAKNQLEELREITPLHNFEAVKISENGFTFPLV